MSPKIHPQLATDGPELIDQYQLDFYSFHQHHLSLTPFLPPPQLSLSLLSEDGGKFHLNGLLRRRQLFPDTHLWCGRAVVMSPAAGAASREETELTLTARTYDPSGLSFGTVL